MEFQSERHRLRKREPCRLRHRSKIHDPPHNRDQITCHHTDQDRRRVYKAFTESRAKHDRHDNDPADDPVICQTRIRRSLASRQIIRRCRETGDTDGYDDRTRHDRREEPAHLRKRESYDDRHQSSDQLCSEQSCQPVIDRY